MIVKKVALLSPSDVDRDRLAKTIEGVSYNAPSKDNNIRFEVARWENLPARLDGRYGQFTCDDYIGDSDIIIAVFRSYAGSQFGSEKSATVHEINNALLKYIRKRYSGDAPRIMVYFCKSVEPAGDLDAQQLSNLKEVLELRKALSSYGLHKVCEDEKSLLEEIKNNLEWVVDEIRNVGPGDEANVKHGGEYLAFIENLICEGVFAWLERDNGFSEKVFKLFDDFHYKDSGADRYYTNFIFNYSVLRDPRLKLLLDRFKDVFAYFACDIIDAYWHITKKEQGDVFKVKVGFTDFGEYATIIARDEEKNALFTFERIQDDSGIEFVREIAAVLDTTVCYRLGIECPRAEECDNREECPALLKKAKPLVFVTPMVSEVFLRNVNTALSTLTDDVDKLPDVFLLSVIESPSREELKHHIKKAGSNLLRELSNEGKLHYSSYFTRRDLESPEILRFVYQ